MHVWQASRIEHGWTKGLLVAPKPTDRMQVTVGGETFSIDDFELGELEWAEDQISMDLDDATSMKQALCFVAIVKRRENPSYTLDDARKEKLTVFDAPPPPKNGTPARPTKAARAASGRGKSGGTS